MVLSIDTTHRLLAYSYEWRSWFFWSVFALPSCHRLKKVPLQVGDLQLLKRTREWEVRTVGAKRETVKSASSRKTNPTYINLKFFFSSRKRGFHS